MKNALNIVPAKHRILVAGALFVAAIGIGSLVGWLSERGADPKARLELARDLAFDKKPDDAMKQVRRALAELGPDGDKKLRLQALTRAAQITDAQLGATHANEALGWYREITRDFPGTTEAFDAGVRTSEILHVRFGDAQHAEQQLLAVVNSYPKQPGVERLLLRAARIAQEELRSDEAVADATRLLTEYPASELADEAQVLLGEVLHQQGRNGEAAKAFEAAAQHRPRSVLAARALEEEANCLAEAGDLSHAMGKYIEALPDHPDPLSVQRSLERVRRRFSALRAVEPGSKAYAFGGKKFDREQ